MQKLFTLALVLSVQFASSSWAGEPSNTDATKSITNPHSGMEKAQIVEAKNISKADGANARTVLEVITKSAELKDKTVRVRGQVVKYNPGIMGKNWIHLRDGSGSADNNTNDLLITTTAQTKLGDVVTISGPVHTNKDFGSGYSYKVLIEDATLQP
jgi:3-hydroxyisobutyrate dehydrogenase-like beta-hydroxyacid dehydrogenase